jgi:hypothetical protein
VTNAERDTGADGTGILDGDGWALVVDWALVCWVRDLEGVVGGCEEGAGEDCCVADLRTRENMAAGRGWRVTKWDW